MNHYINTRLHNCFLYYSTNTYLYLTILFVLFNVFHLLYSSQSLLYAQPFKSEWAWVGLVDQINPPWMTISGEYQQSVTIRMTTQHQKLREGSWVIYLPHSKEVIAIHSPSLDHLQHQMEVWIHQYHRLHHVK